MGCASSKSTPTVESNPDDSIGKTMLENGKSVLMDVENRLGELKDGVFDAASKLESAMLGSPATERAGGNADDTEEITGSEAADSETNAMSLQIDNPPDDSDGLLTNDKPPTPMPETSSLSDVTLCNESDTEKQSEHEDNYGTLNSNIFKAVCTTAANVAMQDTDTDDCPQSYYNSDSSRSNTMISRFSQNSIKTNYRLSDKESSESECESEIHSNRHKQSTDFGSQNQSNDTYVRLGRQLCKDFEYCKTTSKMVGNGNRRCSAGNNNARTMSIKGSMQLTKSKKSLRL